MECAWVSSRWQRPYGRTLWACSLCCCPSCYALAAIDVAAGGMCGCVSNRYVRWLRLQGLQSVLLQLTDVAIAAGSLVCAQTCEISVCALPCATVCAGTDCTQVGRKEEFQLVTQGQDCGW
jgi:hypothetical protein